MPREERQRASSTLKLPPAAAALCAANRGVTASLGSCGDFASITGSPPEA